MEELIDLYVKYYYENKDKFFCLHSGVAVSILSSLYHRFLNDSGIQPLDSIPANKLEEYDIVAEQHIKDGRNKENIVKSAYALELITSTF
jgi:hypothetical protein